MKRRTTLITSMAATALLTLTACSTKADNSGDSGGGGDSGGVKTDIGVTEDEIVLGVQSDLSGVFKGIGLALTHGNQIWADKVNEDGGICERKITLDVVDNGYSPDKAIPLYEQQKGNVLGYLQLIGSPVIAALKTKIEADGMLAVPAAPASVHLDNPHVLLLGITYDVEMINGLAYLLDQGMIEKGDKIGYIYVDSEYGQNGLLGAKYFAEENGITLVEAPISGADTDTTATMTKFKDEGVTAIALTVTPAATASAATQNGAQGLNVPIIGNNPAFTPNMMSDPSVAAAVAEHVLISQGYDVFDGDSELAKEIAKAYDAKTQDQPNYAVNAGYLQGMAWEALLEEACDNGDLTREGIMSARESAPNVDTKGLAGELTLKYDGAPSSRTSFIVQPDAALANRGGVKVVQDNYISKDAESYKTPYQK
ncbi:ABC transporter substrate-binding protein [Blastococcus sp. Marseille-P5729]|uniref:ABC transporter substrate-binding protein n=1 Tax=Blastococcus sp. Marseille-P5729 TaxID=2086582 RepID=UPI000D0FD9B8|nr:ABC transporter substrate-binding protein [Blastococcus sp. Marseille-P5729]